MSADLDARSPDTPVEVRPLARSGLDDPSASPAVEVAGVEVDYGAGPVLTDFSLRVAAGEWVALLGPNGAGKSTALGVLSGLVRHDGDLRLLGDDPRPWKPRRWATTVALVPQRPIIPPGLSVTDYVLLGRTAHIPTFGVESGADLAAVAEAFTRLDLHAFARRPVLALSGGELQRVVLARALVQEARILLLDEPTSALDIGHGQHVLELIDDLRRERGLTIVAAMHDLTLASQYADRVVLLDQGRAIADGTPIEVLTADRVAHHYDATIRVVPDGTGGIVVVPMRPGADPAAPRTPRPPAGVTATPHPTDPHRARPTSGGPS